MSKLPFWKRKLIYKQRAAEAAMQGGGSRGGGSPAVVVIAGGVAATADAPGTAGRADGGGGVNGGGGGSVGGIGGAPIAAERLASLRRRLADGHALSAHEMRILEKNAPRSSGYGRAHPPALGVEVVGGGGGGGHAGGGGGAVEAGTASMPPRPPGQPPLRPKPGQIGAAALPGPRGAASRRLMQAARVTGPSDFARRAPQREVTADPRDAARAARIAARKEGGAYAVGGPPPQIPGPDPRALRAARQQQQQAASSSAAAYPSRGASPHAARASASAPPSRACASSYSSSPPAAGVLHGSTASRPPRPRASPLFAPRAMPTDTFSRRLTPAASPSPPLHTGGDGRPQGGGAGAVTGAVAPQVAHPRPPVLPLPLMTSEEHEARIRALMGPGGGGVSAEDAALLEVIERDKRGELSPTRRPSPSRSPPGLTRTTAAVS